MTPYIFGDAVKCQDPTLTLIAVAALTGLMGIIAGTVFGAFLARGKRPS